MHTVIERIFREGLVPVGPEAEQNNEQDFARNLRMNGKDAR